jgi:hypothetical protein
MHIRLTNLLPTGNCAYRCRGLQHKAGRIHSQAESFWSELQQDIYSLRVETVG